MNPTSWKGYPIADPGDHEHLESRAAHHEYVDKLSREDAERLAYGHYKHDQHARAAAHHLERAQRATQIGDREAADKHRLHYGLHVKAMGHDKSVVPPAEVRQHMGPNKGFERINGFKNHRADSLLSQK